MKYDTSEAPNDRFDRLVDGELSPDEYRALIASLDDQPNGWRRCALAFLEAQALSRDLPLAMRPAAVAPSASAAEVAPAERPAPAGNWAQRVGQALYYGSLAASLALAFYLGSWTTPGPSAEGIQFAGQAQSRSTTAPQSEAAPSPQLAQDRDPIGNVRLVLDGQGEGQSQQQVDVPVYRENQMSAAVEALQAPALPEQFVDQLRKAGHEVTRQHQMLRIELGNGQELRIPVEGYHLTPAPKPTY